jgi:hypothetical protein
LFAQIHAGTPPAEALRELRSMWVRWNRDRNVDWVEHIVLFE